MWFFLVGWFFSFSLLLNLLYTFKLEKQNLDMKFSYTATFMTKEKANKKNDFPLVCYISVNNEGECIN